jgi:hypothetical protein
MDDVTPSKDIWLQWIQFYLFNATRYRHIALCHTEQRYLVTMVTILFI